VCLGDHGAAAYGSVAYANGRVFFECEGSGLVSLTVNTSTPSFSSCGSGCSQPASWHAGGIGMVGSPIVAGGAVWAVSTSGGGLYGFNATTGVQVFHSAGFSANRFSTPAEAGGQIFVPAGNVIRSFNMTLNGCTSVTDTAAPTSPRLSGTSITFTATSTGCADPRYQFWILPPSSHTWQILQAFSAATSVVWNTTGLPAGDYLYTAWARDQSSSGIQCSYLGCTDTFMPAATYTLTRQPCTSVTDTPAPGPPQLSGTSITFTATSTGCPNPLYQFWILPPGSSTWQIKQAYSSSNTFVWNTSGLAPGNYLYTAWARDQSSTGVNCSYLGCNDAFMAAPTYTLTRQPCISVTDTPSPGPPQLSGTSITFTATSSGCPHPLYQFWILPPGSSTWQIKQAYSPSATFTWNTTGLAPGNYLYTAWARDQSSSGVNCSYLGCNDAFMSAPTFSLTRQPCTSVTDSASPASPQTVGTSITFTATSSGCPQPLYQFWILPPGSSTWQIVQPWSPSATFTWNTTGLAPGSYLYTAWARDQSSTGTQCNYLGCKDAVYAAHAYGLT
jgi:streptogramin lyase